MAWLTSEDPRLPELWPGSLDLAPEIVEIYLDAARAACEEFAPVLASPEEPPTHYVIAQAYQARAVARAALAGGQDQIGADGFGVTVFPLDWTVKQLLRPKRGRPGIA